MINGQLRRLQLIQLEILKEIDGFCKEHEIKYSLYAGTLLGAVRHKGFIPWDDDLDICMFREEYNRFVELWHETEHKGYILQNKENSPNFSQSFTKIRKDHTTFLQMKDEIGRYHTGIFVDVFPIDRIPSGKIHRALFHWNCMNYQLLTREFAPTQNGVFFKMVSKIILAITTDSSKRAQKRRRLLKRITANNNNSALETVAIETYASMRKPFAKDMLDSYTTIQFEDCEFMCFEGWDDYLKCEFKEYMELPPENEREWKHHPIIIDFEHNYDELPDEMKL